MEAEHLTIDRRTNAAVSAERQSVPDGTATVRTCLTVNAVEFALDLDPRTTLLDALREHLDLTGTKKGCDQGQCGACTVLINGRRVNACLTLAIMHDGDAITTIKGLGTPGHLHPMQRAFVEHNGFQCGYCTAGQIMSAIGVQREVADNVPSHVTTDLMARSVLSDLEIRERMSGNICRCAVYPNIVAAIREVVGSRHEVFHLRTSDERRWRRIGSRTARQCEVHCRWHQSARSDEAADRDSGPPGGHQSSWP